MMRYMIRRIRQAFRERQYVMFQAFAPLVDSSQSPMLTSVYQSGNLASFVNVVFKVALSIGAILAVLRIAYAGYMYMTSDAWGNKSKAKEILGDVVLGLLLLLGTYLILAQINPDILNLDALKTIQSVPKVKA